MLPDLSDKSALARRSASGPPNNSPGNKEDQAALMVSFALHGLLELINIRSVLIVQRRRH
jgi:hypothetical protein